MKKVFVIWSEHHNDSGIWTAIEAICASMDRAERWLEENGWSRLLETTGGFDWARLDDEPDLTQFDTHDGWEGARIIPTDVEE